MTRRNPYRQIFPYPPPWAVVTTQQTSAGVPLQNVTAIPAHEKGSPGGVATLDENGQIPAHQLAAGTPSDQDVPTYSADDARTVFGGSGLTPSGYLAHQVELATSTWVTVGAGDVETPFDLIQFADGVADLGEPGALPYEDDFFLCPDDFTAVYPKIPGLYAFHFGGDVQGGAGATNLYVDVTLPSYGPCQSEVSVDSGGFHSFGSTQTVVVLPGDITASRYFFIEFRRVGADVTVAPRLRVGFVKAL